MSSRDDNEDEIPKCQFHEMELDDRILKAIANLGWLEPTLIQERAIPLLLEGKDVLIRARTGSGKTGAYAIPFIQKILTSKQVTSEQGVKALVLAPSKELCHQIHTNFLQLAAKCSREVHCVDISPQMEVSEQRPVLAERPDVVVATPTRALLHLKAKTLQLKGSLQFLVIDEADLIFSFGYEEDVKQVLTFMPRVYQAALASATLSESVLSLKRLVLHNTVVLRLREPELAPLSQLTHFHLFAEENDKAAILYTILKLRLVRGKTIIFVNTVDKCYKLKLFLAQFGLTTCVLNSELPATVRCHSVMQFNQGTYDIIIASDEKALDETPAQLPSKKEKLQSHKKSSVKRKREKDQESSAARGIDFQFVSNVINFDFPLDLNSYIHRAGRTARGTNQGTALSFVSVQEKERKEEVEDYLKSVFGSDNNSFKAYQFKVEEVEAFRYRSNDAWRSVTRIAVREARLKEIKQEILNSEKLKGFFMEKPEDLKRLRHDKSLHTVKAQAHLADVPDYMVPASLKHLVTTTNTKRARKQFKSAHGLKYKAKQNNPLSSLEFSGFKKVKKPKGSI